MNNSNNRGFGVVGLALVLAVSLLITVLIILHDSKGRTVVSKQAQAQTVQTVVPVIKARPASISPQAERDLCLTALDGLQGAIALTMVGDAEFQANNRKKIQEIYDKFSRASSMLCAENHPANTLLTQPR